MLLLDGNTASYKFAPHIRYHIQQSDQIADFQLLQEQEVTACVKKRADPSRMMANMPRKQIEGFPPGRQEEEEEEEEGGKREEEMTGKLVAPTPHLPTLPPSPQTQKVKAEILWIQANCPT